MWWIKCSKNQKLYPNSKFRTSMFNWELKLSFLWGTISIINIYNLKKNHLASNRQIWTKYYNTFTKYRRCKSSVSITLCSIVYELFIFLIHSSSTYFLYTCSLQDLIYDAIYHTSNYSNSSLPRNNKLTTSFNYLIVISWNKCIILFLLSLYYDMLEHWSLTNKMFQQSRQLWISFAIPFSPRFSSRNLNVDIFQWFLLSTLTENYFSILITKILKLKINVIFTCRWLLDLQRSILLIII